MVYAGRVCEGLGVCEEEAGGAEINRNFMHNPKLTSKLKLEYYIILKLKRLFICILCKYSLLRWFCFSWSG